MENGDHGSLMAMLLLLALLILGRKLCLESPGTQIKVHDVYFEKTTGLQLVYILSLAIISGLFYM